MNVLDENIPEAQRLLLSTWRIRTRQIGRDLGPKGIADRQIIRLLHQLTAPTLLTRDADFYDRELRHSYYCLAYLEVRRDDTAAFIRRFLRHPKFGTQARRRGTVIRVGYGGLSLWRLNASTEEFVPWAR